MSGTGTLTEAIEVILEDFKALTFKEEHQWNGYSLQVSPHSISPRHFSMVHSRREITIPVRSSPHIEMTEKQDETIEKLSSKATYSEHHSNTSTANIKQNDFNFKKKHVSRPRSISPQKTSRISIEEASKKSRSKSPAKRSLQISETLDYLSPQCQLGGCSATLLVQDTKFLVCKHQLSYVSDYFRSLFLANKSAPTLGAYQNSYKEFAIVVSSFTHPPPAIQFKWFLENAIQTPTPTDITDDTLETCMRLSKRFRAKYLEMKCARYIQDNVTKRTPMIALCWLNWVLKHKFDRTTHDACLPCVAAASVQCLEEHRNLISERLLADLLAAKLRTLYDQVVTVFQTIHRLDHFYMDVVKCPNCGRQQELGKIRIQASPCRKLVGCDRCLKDYNCNLIGKNHNDLQACYQCEHGLVALNDYTSDCQCQIPLLASHLKGLQSHLPSHH
uniref:BTB domain-containing protein n=1 Tax=Setaria digitata TaxID=48799 RepID=A0A915PS31_9BILA